MVEPFRAVRHLPRLPDRSFPPMSRCGFNSVGNVSAESAMALRSEPIWLLLVSKHFSSSARDFRVAIPGPADMGGVQPRQVISAFA
jgi:hypothetical protein